MPVSLDDNPLNRAKNYSNFKYTLSIAGILYSLFLLLIFLSSGLSNALQQALFKLTTNTYWLLPLYIIIISVAYYLLSLPINFLESYALEHKFCLSNQKLGSWFFDQFKAGIISYVISLIAIEFFYYILKYYPHAWWLIASVFWVFFGLILAKLTPLVIIPLFFKYKRICDETLKTRIINLAHKMEVKIIDVFEIDFSSKTLKANAAFVGWGKSRRVILADTLKDKYSYEEIEVILAHEFAHYKKRHLLKLILINSLLTALLFFIIFKTNNPVLRLFNISSLLEMSSLPVVLIYFIAFTIVMQPFQNYISRIFEKDADRAALSITGFKEAFISMMEKLSRQNLSDRNPHPLIKIFFFDHPAVDERIALAESLFN
ncbi:MAG: M48 family metallopeptidase [Candidatus Omnitrophica bacterium]|nr:M48 family metallopeptidase [Candidatus Omnitrophota bacterium]MDD5237901.1 M48 family metallopeptidase [Candidatus Omnitrophota bacterium]